MADSGGPQANDPAGMRIQVNSKRFNHSVWREGWFYYGAIVVTILGSAGPGLILIITADPPGWLRFLGAGLAALAAAVTLVDSRVKTSKRYEDARLTRAKVEELANSYAGERISAGDAMDLLNAILETHEASRRESLH